MGSTLKVTRAKKKKKKVISRKRKRKKSILPHSTIAVVVTNRYTGGVIPKPLLHSLLDF
jgi:hypothetical protein